MTRLTEPHLEKSSTICSSVDEVLACSVSPVDGTSLPEVKYAKLPMYNVADLASCKGPNQVYVVVDASQLTSALRSDSLCRLRESLYAEKLSSGVQT